MVKFIDRETKIKVDIPLNAELSLKGFKLVEDIKRQYPAVDKLVLVLKQYLKQHNLNSDCTYTGRRQSISRSFRLCNYYHLVSFFQAVFRHSL